MEDGFSEPWPKEAWAKKTEQKQDPDQSSDQPSNENVKFVFVIIVGSATTLLTLVFYGWLKSL